MAAVAFGDKVQLIALCRVQGRLQSPKAGIGNRPRRQAVDEVGVIGSWGLQIFLRQIAAVRLTQTVDNGWVGL